MEQLYFFLGRYYRLSKKQVESLPVSKAKPMIDEIKEYIDNYGNPSNKDDRDNINSRFDILDL